MRHRSLDAEAIAATIERLCLRVEVRFPGSGLAGVCRELDAVADRAAETSAWIGRPILPLRVAVGALVAVILAGLVVTLGALRAPRGAHDSRRARAGDRGRGQRPRLRRDRRLLPADPRDPPEAPPGPRGHPRAALDRPRDRHAPAHQGPGVGARPRARDRRPAPAHDEPLRAVALPRLLLRGPLAHRQGGRPVHEGLRRPGRAPGRERGRGPDHRPLPQDLAEATILYSMGDGA